MIGQGLLDALGDAVPADARQVLPESWIAGFGAADVLDLGCGDGRSIDLFRPHGARWTGVDIEGSFEVAERTRSDATFVTFDGVALPFADASFDVVWCKQVLEHVEQPEPLIGEVARVLRPGGTFAGSTSQLEPFHSRSTQNPTPYGVKRWCDRADLVLEEVRPMIDGPALLLRIALGRPRRLDRWWARPSPGNRAIDLAGRFRGWDERRRCAAKLVFCGQFAFRARRL